MTVSTETSKVTYNGNGVTTVFPYTFPILAEGDILVQKKVTATGVISTLILTTDYTVSGVGEASGGNVTLVDAATDAPTGSVIVISRDLAFTQSTDYNEYDAFPASTHETALDRLTMMSQQLVEALDRSIKLDAAVTGVSTLLPTPEASTVIGWNEDADELVNYAQSDVFTSDYVITGSVGILAQTAAGTISLRELTGTAAEITVTNPAGIAGNPTLSLPAAMTFTGKTINGGTYAGIVITGTTTIGTGCTLINPVMTTPTLGVAAATSINFGGGALSSYVPWTTYTPMITLVGGAGNTVPVYTTNSGRYTRLGNVVHVEVYFNGDGGAEGAGTGTINVSLPVTPSASGNEGNFIIVGTALNNATYYLLGRNGALGAGGTISLVYWNLISSVTGFTGDAQNNATRQISLNFSYEV